MENIYSIFRDKLLLLGVHVVKVLYKQANMGFTAEAGFFLGGGKGAFCPKKGVTLRLQAMDFREKKILRKLNTYCKLL